MPATREGFEKFLLRCSYEYSFLVLDDSTIPSPYPFRSRARWRRRLNLLAFVLLLQPSSEIMEKLLLSTASPVVNSVVKKLGVLTSVYADAEKLQEMLTTIQNVLDDAESRSITDKNLRRWLRKLRDAALDAEDVVEEFETEALRRRMEGCDRMAGKVRDFFSSNNSIVFQYKMASKIKEIRKRFDEIADERLKFHLAEGSASEKVVDRETFSFVKKTEVYGRDADRDEVIDFLVSTNNEEEDVSVLPIVGLGGVGKTTLAQYVYNDERLDGRFDLKVWVCVSETFNINDIMRAIIEDVTKSKCEVSKLQSMRHQLETKLSGKVFLLVLDDVWNESYAEWEKLRTLLRVGKKCKIITTTRSDRVAEIMGTVTPKKLQCLDEHDCWTLFKQNAFGNETEEENLTLVEIGKEIVKRCKGLPLAAKALGSLLRFKREEDEWLAVKNNEIWELPMDEEFRILPILKLSYDHLPSHLKRCFTYCSMFPKDRIFRIKTLIQLWMAEGLIDTSDTSLHIEDVGKQYFNNLLQRSFFQDVEMDEYNNMDRCKMHDLVHDLACLLTKDESWFIEEGKENISSKCRYLSIDCDVSSTFLKIINKTKKLRSLVTWDDRYFGMHEFIFNVPKNLTQLHALDLSESRIQKLSDTISRLKHLRLLDLSCTSITTLPTSITRLYNLQILNLYYCKKLQELPEGISRLYNLHTLNLGHCYRLQELPKDISNLINLRHLDISECRSMSFVPRGLGRLSNLQTLSMFIVAQENGRTITELQHLNSIQGSLKIKDLHHVKNPNEATKANLKVKTRLDCLTLQWKFDSDEAQEPSSTDVAEEVLERLQPHHKLKELNLCYYMGSKLPFWMSSSLSKLVQLEFCGLRSCSCLPPLDRLPSLENLTIDDMHALRRIGEEFYGDGRYGAFPSLKQLSLKDMPNLEEWNTEPTIVGRKMTIFLHLNKLFIMSCPKLMVQPCIPCSVKDLTIQESNEVLLSAESLAGLSKLKKLLIKSSFKLTVQPYIPCFVEHLIIQNSLLSVGSLAGLSKLKKLNIDICGVSSLSSSEWWDELQCPAGLKKLEIHLHDELTCLPEGIAHLPSLQTLYLWNYKNLSLNWEGWKQQQPTPFFTALQRLAIQADELIALPEWIGCITSLHHLLIARCSKLAMLPDSLRQLTALRFLSIYDGPQLKERCKRETGEDWHKIAHIPYIWYEDAECKEEDRREADGEENNKICTLVAKFFGLFGLACCVGHN